MVSSNIHLGGGGTTTIVRDDGVRPFKLGEDYKADDLVTYSDGLYRALADITDASEVPLLDLTNWAEFFAHGLEGYGEEIDDELGDMALGQVSVEATASAIEGRLPDHDLPSGIITHGGVHAFTIHFADLGNIPSSIATISSGRIRSHVDGLVLTAPSDQDFRVTLELDNPSHGSQAPRILLGLQGRVNTGSWQQIKSVTHSIPSDFSGSSYSVELDLDDDEDEVFTLDDGDQLTLRWVYSILGSVGQTTGGAVRPVSGERLIFETPTAAQNVPVDALSLTQVPESIVRVHDGEVQARIDGVDIVFPSEEDLDVTLNGGVGSIGGDTFNVSLVLQASVDDGANWVDVKSYEGSLTNEGAGVTDVITLTNAADVSFLDMDEGDALTFRYVYEVTSGWVDAADLTVVNDALAAEVSGSVGARQVVQHGTGANNDKLIIKKAEAASEVPVFDFNLDGEHVGPTKLAGLASDLTAAEQAGIRTKMDVPSMAEVGHGQLIPPANVSVSDNAYALTTDHSYTEYELGMEFIFVAKADSDDDVTVNVDGIGDRELHDADGDLGDGDIETGDILRIIYDGTNFLVFESGDQRASEVSTATGNFDGLLKTNPTTVQSALNVLDDVEAEDIPVKSTGFDGNLATTDNTVQKVAQKLDDLDLTTGSGVSVKTNQLTGLGNAITLTPSPAITAYEDGQRFIFVSPITNSGSVMVNVSGLGARVLRTAGGPLGGGEIQTNGKYEIIYDTNGFLLVNVDTADAISVDTAGFAGVLDGSDGDVQTALDTLDDHDHDAPDAEDVGVDTAGFAGILDGEDDDVQAALDTLDEHDHDAPDAGDVSVDNSGFGNLLTGVTDVQGALDELDGVAAHDIIALTIHFGGILGPDDDTVQEALETLDDHTHEVADPDAASVSVDTTGFAGVLDGDDDDVQAALEALDDHTHENSEGSAAGVSVDATGFTGILGDSDDDVQAALDTLDGYVPDTMQEFVFGQGYHRNDLVRYQDVLYRSKVVIAEADEVPPLDPDNWVEQSSHRLEGYGEVFDQEPATIEFVTVALPARSTAVPVTVPVTLHAQLHSGLPQSLIVVDTGKLKARIDGVVVLFDTDYVSNLVGTLPVDGVAQVSLALQGRVGETGAWRSIAAGVTTWADGVSQGTIPLANANASFSLDTDDLLEFRWIYSLLQGARGEIFTHHSQTEDLAVKVSGIRETRHVLAHGTGENAGKITIEDSVAGRTTAIIDIGAHGGPTYVGPVAPRVFEIGEDYGLGERVEYQEAVYRAIADITDASEVPSLDPDNWVPLSSHGIEGYGVAVNDVSATLSFEDAATLAYGPNTSVNYYDLVLSGVSEMLQDGVAHIDSEGRLVADTDDLEVSFAAGETLTWQWAADGQGTDSIVIYGFLGTVNDGGRELIGVTSFGFESRDDDVLTISIPTQDRTFLLNEGDTLTFELSINANWRDAGTASQGDSETRAVATLNGYRRRRYALGWGTEEDDGKLVATDHNTSTPILEFRDGEPIYIGKVTALRDFEYGARYVAGDNVEYLEVIYRARRTISSADTAPPLDSHNWRAVRGHDLVGYAEVLDSARASYGIAMANVAAQTDEDIEGAELIPLTVSSVSPEVSGHLEVDNGNLQSMVSGLKVVFRNEDDYTVRLDAAGTEAASIAFSLDARVVGEEFWLSVKTGNLLIAADESAGEVALDLDPPADPPRSFTLNSDDELEFRLSYFVISGNRAAGTVTFSDLEVHLDHSEGTLATIGFGTGSDNHKLQGHDPHHDETTDLVEFDSDGVAKWVGPLEDHVVLDNNLRDPGSMTGEFLGGGTHRFEIVNGVPGVGEITHAAALGDTQVRVGISISQEAGGLDEAAALLFHGTGDGDSGEEQAQFRVYSRSFTPITDDDDEVTGYVFVFTGRVVQLNPSLDSFAFGSVGDDVDIAFLSRTHVAAGIAHHSSQEHTVVGYDGGGDLAQVPYRPDSFMNMHVARPSGIWIECSFIASSDAFSAEEQYHSYTNSDGTVDLLVSQRINNPLIDYRNWIKKYDVIELLEYTGSDDGFQQGAFNIYYVLDDPEIDNIDTNDNFNDDTAILRYSLRRVGGDSDNTHPSTSTMHIITNRHGRRVIREVYNADVNFTSNDRFLRIDMNRSWEDFDFMGLSFFNDDSDNSGFAYREVPIHRLKECFVVDSDNSINPNDTPNDSDQFFAFDDRLRPDDTLRWFLARSNNGDGYEGIAVAVEDTGDDANPFRVDYIIQR